MSTITLRSVKGSGLTNNEIDANFTNLNNDKAERSTAVFTGTPQAPTAAVGTVSGQIATTEFVSLEKEIVSGKSQILHQGTIVAICIDLPSKHSDGGAWIDRCSDKSWYNETLGGDRWIGQQATVAAAWTAAGDATGAVFQASATAGPLTIGKFYTATSSSAATEVFRGIKREYPRAGVAWIAETGRVVGYDLGSGAMWMVFVGVGLASWATTSALTNTISSVSAMNGALIVGSSSSAGGGVSLVQFVSDKTIRYELNTSRIFAGLISSRNALIGYGSAVAPGLVNVTVNSVALTVLPNAPIDPGTGLPVPTIYAFTAGGVSRIADDGTVSSTASGGSVLDGGIRGGVVRAFSSSAIGTWPVKSALPTGGASGLYTYWNAGVYYTATVPSTGVAPTGTDGGAIRTASSLVILKENPTTPANGMVAYVTEKYNTGWQVGAIKGAYLADTTAETVTGTTVLSDDFSGYADTAAMLVNWSDATLTDATPTLASGKLRLTRDTANTAAAVVRSFTTVAGKQYVLALGISGDTGYYFIRVGTTAQGYDLLSPGTTALTTSNLTYTFTATGTTSYLSLHVYTGAIGTYIDFDNISVKLAEPDRSVKNKGLIVNGSLTKTAVASGAGLVAWSGFSAANYLEQPYNSDLDFGTGDFAVYGWATPSSLASLGYLFGRQNSGATGSRIYAYVAASTGVINFTTTDGTTSVPISGGAITANSPAFIVCMKSGASVFLYVNAVQVATATAPALTLANATAVLRLGIDHLTTYPFLGSLALWRISATAPSADQIAQIYRDELPLFQTNAQCTLAGTSPAITCQDWDDETGVLHVGTSYGRSSFKGLLRVESEATTVGTPTSISSRGGHIVMGGTSAKLYTPAKYLRDELQRQSEAKKALGRIPVFLDFTATSGQTAFVATKGYRIQALYKGGTLMRESTTGTYWTRSNDGYQETATLSVGATTGDWVSLMLVRV